MQVKLLNRLIQLERSAETDTGSGGTEIAWTQFAEVWANIRHLNGSETLRADFTVSVSKASIRIRRRNDVDATCRAVYVADSKTVYYSIDAVLPDDQNREFVDLVVTAGANRG